MEAVKSKYGGNLSAVIPYGRNLSAVGGFSFVGAVTTLAAVVKPKYGGKPPDYHQGGNFTAGKLPTVTLINSPSHI